MTAPQPDALRDEDVLAAFPDVYVNHDNIAHYRGLLAQQLLINRCSACGYWIYPHRPMCPECWSWDVVATEVSGQGSVFMYTLVHQERDPGTVLDRPVVAAAVELAERPGLRYLAPIVNCELDDIVLDMPVRLTWVERGDQVVPAFEPAATRDA